MKSAVYNIAERCTDTKYFYATRRAHNKSNKSTTTQTYHGDIRRSVIEQLHGIAVQALLISIRKDLRQSSGHHGTRCEH